MVVRYDKRGIGQSGGRPETATLADYADDARAVVNYLRKDAQGRRRRPRRRRRPQRRRLGGAATGRQRPATSRALGLIAGASGTGGALVLEQQQHLLDVMKVPDTEKRAKAELQMRINAAATGQGSWDGIPEALRKQADTPWFASFLAFDPARAMKDVAPAHPDRAGRARHGRCRRITPTRSPSWPGRASVRRRWRW